VVRKGTTVCKNILKGVCKLEGVDIAKMVLDMGINDQLCQAKDFSTQVQVVQVLIAKSARF
jgi:hypothetical protein